MHSAGKYTKFLAQTSDLSFVEVKSNISGYDHYHRSKYYKEWLAYPPPGAIDHHYYFLVYHLDPTISEK